MAARIPRIPLTRILSVVPLLMHALAQVASTTRAPPPYPTHCLIKVLWRGEKARNPSSREWAMSHYEFRRWGMKPDKVTSTLRQHESRRELRECFSCWHYDGSTHDTQHATRSGNVPCDVPTY
uniref:Secreted protein n=1 Tax=Timema cristinae TaxID=61476 RepID=A0A7R9CM89_TIMCR|nr:unnamed protein product [Timema cristinae]